MDQRFAQHVNHPNFCKLIEHDMYFSVLMKSMKFREKFYTVFEEKNQFREVPNGFYEICFQKDEHMKAESDRKIPSYKNCFFRENSGICMND